MTKANTSTPGFSSDKNGRYVIQLRIDNGNLSATVSLTVTAPYPEYALVPVNTSLEKHYRPEIQRIQTALHAFRDCAERNKPTEPPSEIYFHSGIQPAVA